MQESETVAKPKDFAAVSHFRILGAEPLELPRVPRVCRAAKSASSPAPCSMNCREFRRKHGAYIDDTLSGVDFDRMARHRQLCERCSQLDTRVRRALLVARNLPTIQPSATFSDRLNARLKEERASFELARHVDAAQSAARMRPFSVGAYSVIAAGVLVAAGLAGAVVYGNPRAEVIRLAPVVASRPEAEPSPLTTPTIVASMPAGMPLWPAVFVAQQAPWHFASDAARH
jgi:hypothetical protein